MSVRTLLAGVALLALAVAAALLAGDVRSWQQTYRSDDALLLSSPRSAQWRPRVRVPGNLAARMLGVRDDVAVRRALALYVLTRREHVRLDNATALAERRADAEDAIAGTAAHADARSASQLDTLLGVLSFNDVARGGDATLQADASAQAFQNAVRADPSNELAKYDLELLLRALQTQGVRRGAGGTARRGGSGRHGAGGGAPGQGY